MGNVHRPPKVDKHPPTKWAVALVREEQLRAQTAAELLLGIDSSTLPGPYKIGRPDPKPDLRPPPALANNADFQQISKNLDHLTRVKLMKRVPPPVKYHRPVTCNQEFGWRIASGYSLERFGRFDANHARPRMEKPCK
jgi:hypothetical protein